MKTCGVCHEEKAFDQFHRQARSPDGHQSMCIPCRKEYSRNRYLADPDSYKDYDRRRQAELVLWSQSIKNGPCVDCGGRFHFRAMHWDHVGTDKVENVSNLVTKGFGRRRILAEIAKCELVCANCHAVRTYEREQQGIVD